MQQFWRPAVLTLALCVAVLPGCGKAKAAPAFSDVASGVKAKVGTEFSLLLDSNITTGYTWEFKSAPDSKLLALVDSKFEAPSKSDRAGVPGHQRFRFKVLAPGMTKLDLQYVRPWEDPRVPAQTATFTVELS
jgi:inhibitor of cysteine peptidase